MPRNEPPPAPSLQGKTPAPPKLDATTRAAVVMGNWICHDITGIPQRTLVEVFADAIRDAEAAARSAALEEAARELDTEADMLREARAKRKTGADYHWLTVDGGAIACSRVATRLRSLASSPAPAKRAETEP